MHGHVLRLGLWVCAFLFDAPLSYSWFFTDMEARISPQVDGAQPGLFCRLLIEIVVRANRSVVYMSKYHFPSRTQKENSGLNKSRSRKKEERYTSRSGPKHILGEIQDAVTAVCVLAMHWTVAQRLFSYVLPVACIIGSALLYIAHRLTGKEPIRAKVGPRPRFLQRLGGLVASMRSFSFGLLAVVVRTIAWYLNRYVFLQPLKARHLAFSVHIFTMMPPLPFLACFEGAIYHTCMEHVEYTKFAVTKAAHCCVHPIKIISNRKRKCRARR